VSPRIAWKQARRISRRFSMRRLQSPGRKPMCCGPNTTVASRRRILPGWVELPKTLAYWTRRYSHDASFPTDVHGVVLAVLANQLCLPVPGVVFLMAAGAFSAHGHMQPNIVVALSVLACLAADGIWFWLGRMWGPWVMKLLCMLTADPRRYSRTHTISSGATGSGSYMWRSSCQE